MASLDKEEAELEKALASSADEHQARLVAAKQNQELMLVEHLSALNISPGSRGKSSLATIAAMIASVYDTWHLYDEPKEGKMWVCQSHLRRKTRLVMSPST